MDLFKKDNNDDNENNPDFKEGQIIDVDSVKDTYVSNDVANYKKHSSKKTKSGKKILSYILIGLICASLGGVASAAATIHYFNKKQSTMPFSAPQNNASSSSGAKSTEPSASTVPLSVSNVAKKVGPAVVSVSSTSVSSYDMFGMSEQSESVGSGIIFNEEGYIITNYHVIEGGKQINVIFNTGDGGKEHPAKLVNYDATMDVAVIKLTDKVKVPGVAEFGDSNALQVGEPAIAIGNPLGKEFLGSVTSGVISAVNREIPVSKNSKQKQKFIQTDAAINKGNSGGPLVNMYGQVIGINTVKLGGNSVEGMGFAIPINTIKPNIKDLIKPFLRIGISATDIDKEISKQYNLPIGILIRQIDDGSPADAAGLRPGDVITKFGGKAVTTTEQLNKIKQGYNVNDTVKVTVSRNGKNKTFDLKLKEY